MIIMGRPWRIKMMCSHCGATRNYLPDKVARPCPSRSRAKV